MYYKDQSTCDHCWHSILWSINTSECDVGEVMTKKQCCWCGLTKEEKSKSTIKANATHGPFLRR